MKNTLIFSFLLITPFQYSFSQTPCCNPYIRDGEELERRGDYCKALSEFKRGINSCCGSNDGKINEVCCNTLKAKIREIQSRCRVREDDPLPSPIQANKHDDLWNSAKASKDYDSIKVHIICNDLTHRNEAKHLVQELEKKDTDRWNAVKTSMNIRKIKSEYLDKQIKPFNFVNEATDRVRKLNEEEELWGKIANSEDPETIQHVYRDSCELCAFDSLAIIRINWLIRAMKPELVFIKGGIFNMGNTFNKTKDLDISEKPHQVTVNNFYICKYEVSFKEFDVFCREQKRDKPDDNNWGRGKYPVMNITWYDAIEFCNWRSLKDTLTAVYKKSNEVDDSGRPIYIYSKSANGYRLPTEAEWEYAARGGENVPFGDGNENPDTKNFNFDGSMLKQNFRGSTVPISSLKVANNFGLFEMSGNVSEWCWDAYGVKYYDESNNPSNATNPSGPKNGSEKVVRGGAWGDTAKACTVYHRQHFQPQLESVYIGFRVVRSSK